MFASKPTASFTTPLSPAVLKAFDLVHAPAVVAKRAETPDSGLSEASGGHPTACAATDPGAVPAAAVLPQLTKLLAAFPEPTTFGVCTTETGETAPCCVAATAFIEGAVMASSARHGVAGVLDVMQSRFKWGTARCWTLCECMKQREIDCGGGMNVAVAALRHEPSVVDGTTRVCKVQIVQRWPREMAAIRRDAYDGDSSANATEVKKQFLTSWIEDDCCYHQCVGLIRPDGAMRVWDYGKWHMPPTDWTLDSAVLAIKITPDVAATAPATADWMGLEVPTTGEWVTLLPAEHAGAGGCGCPNVEPVAQSLTLAGKRAVLQSVFAAEHTVPAGTPADAVAQLAPRVYIGGNHMSSNPCPGNGVSRAIRLRFPSAVTVAVGNKDDSLNGVNDQTYTRALGMGVVMMPHLSGEAQAQHWRMVCSALADDQEAFYLPCSDAEIDRVSEQLHNHSSPELRAAVGPRVLAPPPAAVAVTEKPAIAGAKAMGIFEIPEFMLLDAETHSQTDVEAWCKVRGYPVLVKGPVQGATVCHSWSAVLGAVSSKWGSGGYVQVSVTGFQMGLAFAAYEGELTAAVLMEKTGYVGSKAWSGELRAVPPVMLAKLRKFCREHNWTGGGELEYMEDMAGKWHAIDWNPRFPAWIFGGCYAGVNLPAALIQHAMHKRSHGEVPFPEDVAAAALTATAAFTRTAVEIPILHHQLPGQAGFPGFAVTDYSKAGTTPTAKPKMNMLPPGFEIKPEAAYRAPTAATAADHETQQGAQKEEVEKEQKHQPQHEGATEPDAGARGELAVELNRLIPADTTDMPTPRFVLSRDTVRSNLLGHKAAVERALAELEDPPALAMCLSVKTQPNPAVLAEARDCGYMGEVITTAEMQACIDAGWSAGEIVMNGPGKWYGDVSGPRVENARPTEPLRCLFADSLADLETIVDRILDPEDWLDAKVVGVRFSPAWVVGSRFGLNCKDPRVLKAAAAQMNRLPARVQTGLHMHFAASKLGVVQWFGLARGYVRVVCNFAKLLAVQPTVLDFGGGWPSHLLDHDEVHPHLVQLLGEAQAALPQLECVQFEPGKSITERAGAVVTKVIAIREMERKVPDKTPVDGVDEVDNDDDKLFRAAVVDACISDMGSMPLHVHPLLWQHGGDGADGWSTLEAGKDQLWGSICMEFDVLGSQFTLPDDASVGDNVLIAFTGAYDTTMSYEFADGKGRDIELV